LQGGILWERGLYDEAEPLLTQAYEGYLQSGDLMNACMAAQSLAGIDWLQGTLHRAAELYQQAIRLAGQSPASTYPHMMLGFAIFYEWNDLEAAVSHQVKVIELSKLSGEPNASAIGYCLLAEAKQAKGDIAGAATAAEKSDQLAQAPGVNRAVRARLAVHRVLQAIWQEDPAATEYWRTQLMEYTDVVTFGHAYVPPRALIACDEKEAAAERLEVVHKKAKQTNVRTVLIKALVCQALTAASPVDEIRFLTEALTLGQPEGFIRTFVDEGKLLKPLLRKALAQGITPEYTAKLLNIIEAKARQRHARSGTTPSQTPGLLSERELEILSLINNGLSNQQISERLFISLGTVKRHVHNSFGKLNTKTRTQTIAQAKQLGLN
jgi:LuxR family maltose regulon positive regulatory protein